MAAIRNSTITAAQKQRAAEGLTRNRAALRIGREGCDYRPRHQTGICQQSLFANETCLKYCGNTQVLAYGYGGSGHAEPRMLPTGAVANDGLCYFGIGVMRVQGGHWLDYDAIALAALVIGIRIVMLVVLGI